jgi:hypothetical protein
MFYSVIYYTYVSLVSLYDLKRRLGIFNITYNTVTYTYLGISGMCKLVKWIYFN